MCTRYDNDMHSRLHVVLVQLWSCAQAVAASTSLGELLSTFCSVASGLERLHTSNLFLDTTLDSHMQQEIFVLIHSLQNMHIAKWHMTSHSWSMRHPL